jgi:hypothetical protein
MEDRVERGSFCIMHPDVRLDEISPPW